MGSTSTRQVSLVIKISETRMVHCRKRQTAMASGRQLAQLAREFSQKMRYLQDMLTLRKCRDCSWGQRDMEARKHTLYLMFSCCSEINPDIFISYQAKLNL